MKRLSSTRLRLAPSPPVLISSSARDTAYLLSRLAWRDRQDVVVVVPRAPDEAAVLDTPAARPQPADLDLVQCLRHVVPLVSISLPTVSAVRIGNGASPRPTAPTSRCSGSPCSGRGCRKAPSARLPRSGRGSRRGAPWRPSSSPVCRTRTGARAPP